MRKLLRFLAALTLLGWVCLASAPATLADDPPSGPSITAPGRAYTGINIPLVFASDDLITTDSDAISVVASADTCDPAGVLENPDLSGCAALKLDLSGGSATGSLSVVVTTPASNPDVTYPIAQGGAYVVMSSNDDGTGSLLQLDGTAEQINDALKTLIFTPANDYHNANLSPDFLHLHLLDGNDSSSTADQDVALRIDGINSWPALTVPGGQTVAASDHIALPDPAPSSGNGDFSVTDSDIYRHELDDYLLVIMWSTCGTFSLRNGLSFTLDNNLEHLLTSSPLSLDPTLADTIIGLLPSDVGSVTASGTGNPMDEHSAFFGLAEANDQDLSDLNYDLSQVTFYAPSTSGTCTLWTVVSDLGNNGLPLHWVSGTPGYEVPDLGIDIGSVTFTIPGDETTTTTPPETTTSDPTTETTSTDTTTTDTTTDTTSTDTTTTEPSTTTTEPTTTDPTTTTTTTTETTTTTTTVTTTEPTTTTTTTTEPTTVTTTTTEPTTTTTTATTTTTETSQPETSTSTSTQGESTSTPSSNSRQTSSSSTSSVSTTAASEPSGASNGSSAATSDPGAGTSSSQSTTRATGPVTVVIPPRSPGGSGTLSNTGFNTAWTLTLGAGLIAFGAGVLLLIRRRA